MSQAVSKASILLASIVIFQSDLGIASIKIWYRPILSVGVVTGVTVKRVKEKFQNRICEKTFILFSEELGVHGKTTDSWPDTNLKCRELHCSFSKPYQKKIMNI